MVVLRLMASCWPLLSARSLVVPGKKWPCSVRFPSCFYGRCFQVPQLIYVHVLKPVKLTHFSCLSLCAGCFSSETWDSGAQVEQLAQLLPEVKEVIQQAKLVPPPEDEKLEDLRWTLRMSHRKIHLWIYMSLFKQKNLWVCGHGASENSIFLM